jgi:hypothetical protein
MRTKRLLLFPVLRHGDHRRVRPAAATEETHRHAAQILPPLDLLE